MYRSGVLSRRKEANLVFYAIADESVIELCRTVCVQVASRLEDNALPSGAVDRFMVQPEAAPARRRRAAG
ncbi:hypothetical protein D9M69_695570 [compost metagenome]